MNKLGINIDLSFIGVSLDSSFDHLHKKYRLNGFTCEDLKVYDDYIIINIYYNLLNDTVIIENKLHNKNFDSFNTSFYIKEIYLVDCIKIDKNNELINIILKYYKKNKFDEILDLVGYSGIYNFNSYNDCVEHVNSLKSFKKNIKHGTLETFIIIPDGYVYSYVPKLRYDIPDIYNHKLIMLYFLCLYNNFDDLQLAWPKYKKKMLIGYKNINYIIYKNIHTNSIMDNSNIDTLIEQCNNTKTKYINIDNEYIKNNNFIMKNLECDLNHKLYEHQENNIKWMSYIEKNKKKFITDYNINNLSMKYYNHYHGIYNHMVYNIPYYYNNFDNNFKYPNDNNKHIYINYLEISKFNNNNNISLNFTDDKNLNNDEFNKELYNGYAYLNGGIIADDVGLGKTLTIIGYLILSKENDNKPVIRRKYDLNTLIILPNRLISQWKSEFKKFLKNDKIKIFTIGTLTDIKKMNKLTLAEIKSYDVFLVSNTLFGNQNYINEYVKDKPMNKCNLFKKKWNRIIIDEAHEIMISHTLTNYKKFIKKNRSNLKVTWNHYYNLKKKEILKKKERIISFNIQNNLNSNYKWCISATPYLYGMHNFISYFYWLSDIKIPIIYDEFNSPDYLKYVEDNIYTLDENKLFIERLNLLFNQMTINDYNKFNSNYIRKNYKKRLQNNNKINIPSIDEEIIWVKQNNIEKEIYNTYSNGIIHYYDKDKILFKLCTNLLIANIFSVNNDTNNVEFLSLEEINDSFIKNLNKQLHIKYKKKKEIEERLIINNDIIFKSNEIINFFTNISTDRYIAFMINLLEIYFGYNISNKKIKNIIEKEINEENKYNIENIIKDTDTNNLNKLLNNNNINNEYKNMLNDYIDNCITIDDIKENFINKLTDFVLLSINILETYKNTKYIVLINTFYNIIKKINNSSQSKLDRAYKSINDINDNIKSLNNQITIMDKEAFIKERIESPCIICWCDYEEDTEIIVTKCRHIMCGDCFNHMIDKKKSINCPECRGKLTINDISKSKLSIKNKENNNNNDIINENNNAFNKCVKKYGTKMSLMIKYLLNLFNENNDNRVIIFSQYDDMLKLISQVLNDFKIKFVFCKGNVNVISKNITKFKENPLYRVILLSSDRSNSGSNLTEASHIFLIDVLNMDKHKTINTETQAIGRSVRLGQNKNVKVVRFITCDTIEEKRYHENKYDIKNIDT